MFQAREKICGCFLWPFVLPIFTTEFFIICLQWRTVSFYQGTLFISALRMLYLEKILLQFVHTMSIYNLPKYIRITAVYHYKYVCFIKHIRKISFLELMLSDMVCVHKHYLEEEKNKSKPL